MVESCSGAIMSLHCQASHPAPVPALVPLVQNETGGIKATISVTTTDGDQGSWVRCHNNSVTRSTRRQGASGAAAGVWVNLYGGEYLGVGPAPGGVTSCDIKETLLRGGWSAELCA